MNISDYNGREHAASPWNIIFPWVVRLFVWGSIVLILYVLRAFFLLIFLTFIFSYIQSRGVERLSGRIKSRTARVLIVSFIFLSILAAIGSYLVPKVRDQAATFASNFSNYMHLIDSEIIHLSETYPIVRDILPAYSEQSAGGDSPAQYRPDLAHSPSAHLLRQIFGVGDSGGEDESLKALLALLRNFGATLLSISSAFLLSLLFSFLILLDLPALTKMMQSLQYTKLSFMYHEASNGISNFARVVGRAFEAQVFISLINTMLTIIGVNLLGLQSNLAFISMIVFLCGFIPVAGVFISSVPICLIALQHGGVGLAAMAALMIWVLHMVEAYILNPKIYGHHLRLNAILVLIILTIGGKLFNVWGLVLGLPVCTYIFGHAIKRDEDRQETLSF